MTSLHYYSLLLCSLCFGPICWAQDDRLSAVAAHATDRQLILAIEENSLKKVRALIGSANINGQDFFGYSPLHYAVEHGNIDIVALLIQSKALLNQVTTQGGDTPLLLATEKGHMPIVSLLLAAGADVEIVNQRGYNALHLAIQHKNKHLVQSLLQAGASCNSCTAAGYSPLVEAIQVGSFTIVALLLKQKEILDVQDKDGFGALHWAIIENKANLLKMILLSSKFNVNAAAKNGLTPLHLLAMYRTKHPKKHPLLLKYLLSQPLLEINAKDSTGSTPLHYASDRNQFKVVYKLLEIPTVDLNSQNNAGQTALHYAVQGGHMAIVKRLLPSVGRGLLIANKQGKTALELAMHHGHTKICQLLLRYISLIEGDESVVLDRYANGKQKK